MSEAIIIQVLTEGKSTFWKCLSLCLLVRRPYTICRSHQPIFNRLGKWAHSYNNSFVHGKKRSSRFKMEVNWVRSTVNILLKSAIFVSSLRHCNRITPKSQVFDKIITLNKKNIPNSWRILSSCIVQMDRRLNLPFRSTGLTCQKTAGMGLLLVNFNLRNFCFFRFTSLWRMSFK